MAATKTKAKTKVAAPTVTVTVAQFDQPRFDVLRNGVSIAEFAPVTAAEYTPLGMTPLLDATARFIGLLDGLRDPEKVTIGLLADASGSMQPNRESVVAGINEFVEGMTDVEAVDSAAAGKVLCVILTDGLENASHEVTRETLATIIADRERDGWTFIYMGANQDAWGEAAGLGYSGGATGQAVNYVATRRGTENAMRSVTSHAQHYLGDNEAYGAMAAASSQRSVAEDGTETTGPQVATPAVAPPAPPTPAASYGSVTDALKAAKEATEK